MTSVRHLNLLFILVLTFSFTCAGCAPKSTEKEVTPIEAPADYPGASYEAGDDANPAGYYIHTVKLPDESISIIAKWFTGDLMNWEVLAKCNPTINPNRIFLGDNIRIPRNIITRKDPMTPAFVMESQPSPKKKKVKNPAYVTAEPSQKEKPVPADISASEPVEAEPLLFGPKGFSKD